MNQEKNIIVNKVDASGLVTIDLADFYTPGERVLFDLKPLLVEEFLLKEKDFREFVKNNDWSVYMNKLVAITCTNDAIIPVWAYMLLSAALKPFASFVFQGTIEEMDKYLFLNKLSKLNPADYTDQRIVIKGCGDIDVSPAAYVALSAILQPVVKSIMYGEPCSTVPVYKRKT